MWTNSCPYVAAVSLFPTFNFWTIYKGSKRTSLFLLLSSTTALSCNFYELWHLHIMKKQKNHSAFHLLFITSAVLSGSMGCIWGIHLIPRRAIDCFNKISYLGFICGNRPRQWLEWTRSKLKRTYRYLKKNQLLQSIYDIK